MFGSEDSTSVRIAPCPVAAFLNVVMSKNRVALALDRVVVQSLGHVGWLVVYRVVSVLGVVLSLLELKPTVAVNIIVHSVPRKKQR